MSDVTWLVIEYKMKKSFSHDKMDTKEFVSIQGIRLEIVHCKVNTDKEKVDWLKFFEYSL